MPHEACDTVVQRGSPKLSLLWGKAAMKVFLSFTPRSALGINGICIKGFLRKLGQNLNAQNVQNRVKCWDVTRRDDLPTNSLRQRPKNKNMCTSQRTNRMSTWCQQIDIHLDVEKDLHYTYLTFSACLLSIKIRKVIYIYICIYIYV